MLAATALEVAVFLVGLVQQDRMFIGLLVIGPLLAAASSTLRATASVAALSVGFAAVLTARADMLEQRVNLLRIAGVVIASSLAVVLAARRRRSEHAMYRLQRVADAAQSAILRPVPARIGNVECAARYCSATEEANVGGDFYEVLDTRFGLRAVVGDVRGKGIDATRLAAVLLGCFREAALAEPVLTGVAKLLDDRARTFGTDEEFATALLLEIDDDALRVVSCGHPPPLRVSAQGVVLLETPVTVPLGLGSAPTDRLFPFAAGERLLAYTDGIIEARNARGDFFDLVAAACTFRTRLQDELLEEMLAAVTAHVGHRIDDDVALMLLHRTKGAEPPQSPA